VMGESRGREGALCPVPGSFLTSEWRGWRCGDHHHRHRRAPAPQRNAAPADHADAIFTVPLPLA
jgi:hypothetical protein